MWSVNKEFNKYLEKYWALVDLLEGRGEESQPMIDRVFEELGTMAANNPELAARLPVRVMLYDDGCHGKITGIQTLMSQRFRW